MTRTLALAVSLVVLTGSGALAEPPPPEILQLIQKLRNGGTLTTEEQTQLRAWQQQTGYSAGGGRGPANGGAMGAMPDDIAAIMSKTQRGVPPTPEELEKLRAWGKRTNQHQDEIIKDEHDKRAVLEDTARHGAEWGARGPAKNPFLDGVLKVSQLLVTTSFDRCDDAPKVLITDTSEMVFDAPVRLRTREPGKELSYTAQLGASGPFSVLTGSIDGRPSPVTVRGSHAGCHPGSASSSTIATGAGEFNVQSGRVFVNVPGVQSFDSLRSELVWQGSPALNAELLRAYPQAAAATSQLPPYLKAARDSATFTMKGEALRAAILGGKPAEVSGVYSTSWRTPEGASSQLTVTYTLVLRPPPTAEFSMAVLDDSGKPSAAAWSKWEPLPWLESDDEAKFFGLKRHDPKGGVRVRLALTEPKRCKLHVELVPGTVSTHKGVTTNWPVKGEERLTMRIPFEPNDSPKVNDGWVVAAGGQSADTKAEVGSIDLQLATLDTAAWGQLRASCPSSSLDAQFEPTGKTVLVLPRDDNQNHVADQYEEDNGARGKNLASNFDEDENPKPKQRRNGDGYTLFEEYRGFVVRTSPSDATRKFVRTDWNTKTAFAFDPDKLFEKFLLPYNPMKFEWFVLDESLARLGLDENDPEQRWVNTNSPEGDATLSSAKQYLIPYKRDNTLKANAEAAIRSGADPHDVGYLHNMRTYFVVRVNERKSVGAFQFGAPQLSKCSRAQVATIQEHDTAVSVIHETGHFLGVSHHLQDHRDIQNPPRKPNGDARWDEEGYYEQRFGVFECTMRYNARYNPADDYDDLDARPMTDQCERPVFGFCKATDRASYVIEHRPQADGGDLQLIENQPSNDCWGQIDVKNDPQ